MKELGPDNGKENGREYIAFDDVADVVSPTLSRGDPASNNADLALLCTHSVSSSRYCQILKHQLIIMHPQQ